MEVDRHSICMPRGVGFVAEKLLNAARLLKKVELY